MHLVSSGRTQLSIYNTNDNWIAILICVGITDVYSTTDI